MAPPALRLEQVSLSGTYALDGGTRAPGTILCGTEAASPDAGNSWDGLEYSFVSLHESGHASWSDGGSELLAFECGGRTFHGVQRCRSSGCWVYEVKYVIRVRNLPLLQADEGTTQDGGTRVVYGLDGVIQEHIVSGELDVTLYPDRTVTRSERIVGAEHAEVRVVFSQH